jgi:hypothetical protein
MVPVDSSSVESRRRRERRVWRAGLVVSLVLHLGLFFGWRGSVLPTTVTSAAGPDRGDARAAAGTMQALTLRATPPRAIVPPPVPIAVEATVEVVEFEDEPQVDPAELLGDRPGLDEAPGVDAGTGRGDQGRDASGVSEMQPPSPRGLIIPPTNRELRGTEVQVWVFVDAAGRVVPDSTRLEPATRDRDFNRRLIREAAEWVFRPAMRRGTPVAAWFPYRIIM